MFDYAGIAAAVASAIFWARGAQMEGISPFLWVAISLVLSAIVLLALHGGWVAVLASQLAMFVGIAVFRVVTEKKPDE